MLFFQGAGWWKYEFCYQKKVDQYHIHEDLSKTVVRLVDFSLSFKYDLKARGFINPLGL